MHVGLLIYGSLDRVSGGYLYDRQLVRHLRRQGDRVTLVSLPWRSYFHHMTDNFSGSLSNTLLDNNLDILVQDELNHPSLFILNSSIKRHLPYPVVGLIHHLRCSEAFPAWQRTIYAWIEKKFLRSVDGLIANSCTTLESVRNLGIGRDKPSIVAYPGGDRFGAPVHEHDIRRKAQQNGPLRLIFVGNLIPRKGLHVLVDALNKIPKSLWTLKVVGRTDLDPAYMQSVQQKIDNYHLRDCIEITGLLDDASLEASYQASHVLVVPSSYEGFGIVYLEAMRFGLPVIAGVLGGAGEIVTDGREGYLVAQEDADHLAFNILLFIQDRSRLEKMGLRAHKRFCSHPTWERSMDSIRTFLSKMVAQYGRTG